MKASEFFDWLKYPFCFSKKLFIMSMLLWGVVICIGLYIGLTYDSLPETSHNQLNIFLYRMTVENPIFSGVMNDAYSGNYMITAVSIFLNNVFASFLLIAYGFTVFLAVNMIYVNGYLIGLLYGLFLGSTTHQILSPIQGILLIVYSVLELVAYSLSMSFGIRLLLSVIAPRWVHSKKMGRMKSFKITLSGFTKIFSAVVTLLLLAAAMETYLVLGETTKPSPYSQIFEQCGITFEGVVPGSPAARGGFAPYTRIVSVDGQKILNVSDFAQKLGTYKPGDFAVFGFSDGQNISIRLDQSNEKNAFIGIIGVHTTIVKTGKCF